MLSTYFQALGIIIGMGFMTWLYSLLRRNVNSVDSLWSMMFLAAAGFYLWSSPENNSRTTLIFALVAIWALRLSIHLTLRNWNKPEDRRYAEIRRNNQPGFKIKSLYIIFILQGVLAWIISAPLLYALYPVVEFHWLDVLGIGLWILGFTFESVADWQLLRFQKNPVNDGKVLNSGLWRYSRHPNYFGEFCLWWGFYLLAIPAGAWWSIFAPVLMTFLLLRVSGVLLMEKDISSRRPAYQDYIENTNAFFPGLPDQTKHSSPRESAS